MSYLRRERERYELLFMTPCFCLAWGKQFVSSLAEAGIANQTYELDFERRERDGLTHQQPFHWVRLWEEYSGWKYLYLQLDCTLTEIAVQLQDDLNQLLLFLSARLIQPHTLYPIPCANPSPGPARAIQGPSPVRTLSFWPLWERFLSFPQLPLRKRSLFFFLSPSLCFLNVCERDKRALTRVYCVVSCARYSLNKVTRSYFDSLSTATTPLSLIELNCLAPTIIEIIRHSNINDNNSNSSLESSRVSFCFMALSCKFGFIVTLWHQIHPFQDCLCSKLDKVLHACLSRQASGWSGYW